MTEETPPQVIQEASDNTPIIIGLSAAIFVLLVIGIVIIICIRRNRDPPNTILVTMRPMTKVIEIPQYEDDDSGADLEGPKSLHNDSSRVSIKMGSTRVILQDMGSGGQAHSASRLPPINENET